MNALWSFRDKSAKRIARWLAAFITPELRQAIKNRFKAELKMELKEELKAELKIELKPDFELMIAQALQKQFGLANALVGFKQTMQQAIDQADEDVKKSATIERLCGELRSLIRHAAGLSASVPLVPMLPDLLEEVSFLRLNQEILKPVFKKLIHKRVLFVGQAYYNAWYLSRALRERGWKADVLNWDMNPASQIYYHGEDFVFDAKSPTLTEQMLQFYVSSLYAYDVFHFSNAHGITFGWPVQGVFEKNSSKHSEIRLLKELGKKIVYTNNGCLDGVSQTAFAKWGQEPVCAICRWRDEPNVCSDEKNMAWGKFRNSVADYQCLLGGNRADYNDDPTVHEAPEVYCLDRNVWQPGMEIPMSLLLPQAVEGTIWLYHGVGNRVDRTTEDGVNIKSSHVYLPLIQKLKQEGLMVELLEPTGIPNKDVRFLQAQADIFLEMLSYGWFGANAREAMMLGKPVICYIRPEWLESLRQELPDYAAELPIISATPGTVEEILRDLIANPQKRVEIGRQGREFAVKWHSAEAAGRRFDEIYSRLLQGDPMLRATDKLEFSRG